jgi:hypothetical protein
LAATDSGKPGSQLSTPEILLELLGDEGRQVAIFFLTRGEEAPIVGLNDRVEDALLRLTTTILSDQIGNLGRILRTYCERCPHGAGPYDRRGSRFDGLRET